MGENVILQPGVICLYDNNKDCRKYIYPKNFIKYNNARYIPIGVIVTPIGLNQHLMISLPIMQCNSPTTGSIDKSDSLSNRIDMKWGPSITISRVPNIKSAEEAFANFNGKEYTDAIIETRGKKDYSSWKPNDLTGSIDYPAASCCDIFFTQGTEQQMWYLPACGELNYLYVNYEAINNALQILVDNGVFCCTLDNDRYWSCNDYGGVYAWNFVPANASIDYNNKVTNGYKVRAFYKIN